MDKESRILVLGHRGLVGSALVRLLQREGYSAVLAPASRVDLRDQQATQALFQHERPEFVLMAAGTVGGIGANSSRPYDFIYDNLSMAANVVECSRLTGVNKLLMLGSTCIYPRLAPQPIKEEALLAGPLEPTNQWYAIAKIAGIKLGQAARLQHGQNVIAAMPTNLYGPNDNFDLETCHVLPALVRRFHEAKVRHSPEVTMWGTGAPRREFLHVDDLARALVLLMQEYDESEIMNVGCGEDCTIAELAALVQEVVGYEGRIVYDSSKPDGTPKKQTDITRISAMGWAPQIPLRQGLAEVYHWYSESAVTTSDSEFRRVPS